MSIELHALRCHSDSDNIDDLGETFTGFPLVKEQFETRVASNSDERGTEIKTNVNFESTRLSVFS